MVIDAGAKKWTCREIILITAQLLLLFIMDWAEVSHQMSSPAPDAHEWWLLHPYIVTIIDRITHNYIIIDMLW